MSDNNSPKNCPLQAQRTLYRGFEGGSIYTSENDGKFLIIIDEGTMSDLLPADEIEGMKSVEVIEFGSELERSEYLTSHFGSAARCRE